MVYSYAVRNTRNTATMYSHVTLGRYGIMYIKMFLF